MHLIVSNYQLGHNNPAFNNDDASLSLFLLPAPSINLSLTYTLTFNSIHLPPSTVNCNRQGNCSKTINSNFNHDDGTSSMFYSLLCTIRGNPGCFTEFFLLEYLWVYSSILEGQYLSIGVLTGLSLSIST